MGGSLDFLHGKTVLEAGCGAGRFTEVLLSAGAKVFALDLSSAVEAAYQNVGNNPNVFVCQADILDLPLGPEQFDIVVCIGVVQHTPDPEETIRALSTHVKPGGILILDHYTYGYPVMASRRFLRQVFLRLPSAASFQACRAVVALLWPIHVILWKHRQHPLAGSVRDRFLRYSPVVDYHGAYEQLGPNLLRAWAMLDTHDTLTDAYKHMRSADEIEDYLARCGLTDIRTAYAGNGVEARARKPVRQEKPELNRKVKSA
jgi:SAM-dependent methyltransferase